MRRFIEELRDFPKKGDWVLLILCLVTSGYGGIMVASATNAAKFGSNTKYILIQLVATALGVMIYAIVSSIDVDFMSEHRTALVIFNVCLLLLLIPFGDDHSTGNKSWLTIPLVPVSIQPAEIARIAYIIIMSSVMASHQNYISSIPSVLHMVFHLGLVTGLNMVLSGDAGVSLVFVFVFIGMAFAGGVSLWWFAVGIGGVAALVPFVWPHLGAYQQERILVLIDPEYDKMGIGARYHSKINLQSLTGGGLTDRGREYVREAQRLGMLVDVSHISDEGFWDIMEITNAPVIATHSNSRAVCAHSRNLTDDMFRAICQTGGVAGINQYASFLGEHPTLDTVCDHVFHFMELDPEGTHIALGGDSDGCSRLAAGFTGIESYPSLADRLMERGLTQENIQNIFWNNPFRVLQTVQHNT